MIHPWTPSKGRCLALALALPLLAACAPKSYVVKTPTPSAQVVANAPTPVAPHCALVAYLPMRSV